MKRAELVSWVHEKASMNNSFGTATEIVHRIWMEAEAYYSFRNRLLRFLGIQKKEE